MDMRVSLTSRLGAVLLSLGVVGCGSSSSVPDAAPPDAAPDRVDATVSIPDASAPDATPTVRMLIGTQGGDLVQVNPATAETTIIATPSIADIATPYQDQATGTVYAISQDFAGKVDLVTLDPCDASAEVVAPILLAGSTIFYGEGFAIDPSTSVLYISASLNGGVPGDSSSEAFLSVDLATGAATLIGAFGGDATGDIDGLGFAEGVLYGYDVQGANTDTTPLFSIDPATGVATAIGSPAMPSQPSGLAYDDQTSTMYAAANKPIDGLITVDLALNTVSQVGVAEGLRNVAIVDVVCE